MASLLPTGGIFNPNPFLSVFTFFHFSVHCIYWHNQNCFAPSRPTFYRKRIVSQRKRDGIGNPGQELVYHLYYLPPALCNGKQSLRAKFPTLSHTKQV